MRQVRHSAISHVGRVRQVNEDSLLSLPERQVWAVSDGMGGHAAGDFASQTVVETIVTAPETGDPGERMRAIRSALHDAHARIKDYAISSGLGTVGATVVVLLLSEAHFMAFWVGDSRLYRVRNAQIELLTHDHSIVGALVEAGELTWDEADHHPQSNAITRAVGVGDALEIDKRRGELQPGDRFLLCTDGLNKYIGFEELQAELTALPIETVSQRLVQIALDRGGADNVSVIVVDV
ncbi:PP2C family protein-serine/threonine phosphatase [Aliiruegeria sabulilitoris]|uniref:PP2C family protein-serine/threonine phosphatase n=1 Tax=Aliiruegeria sabulilitoris TaxID=1510458 RepID=UPI000835E012|nr:protein phosphatase 2C domain-containing protein [Aliiruegeria sabulilitoris]NDR59033.1 serine/threonine-protein phosphatase [Pseudoruegeria sp. M32A2M]